MFYIFIFSKPQTPNPSPCNTSVQLHTHDFNSKFGSFLQVPCSFLLGISVRKHRKYKISTFLGSSPCLQWGCSSSFPSQLFPVPEAEPGDVDGQAAHTPRQVMREGNQALDVSHPCTNPFVFQKLFESCGFPPTPFFLFFSFFPSPPRSPLRVSSIFDFLNSDRKPECWIYGCSCHSSASRQGNEG